MSTFTTRALPAAVATCKTVQSPPADFALTSAPASRSILAISVSPRVAAKPRRCRPSLSGTFTSAPAAISSSRAAASPSRTARNTAVCSSLSLGLGIDFAIHFLQRFRTKYAESKDLEETNRYMFGEPGRAIARNAIVISLGFLPLVASSLTPYVTVGFFFALLMTFSTISTLFLLPAALRIVGPRILKGGKS